MKLIDSHFHTLMFSSGGNSIEAAFSSIAGGIDIGTEYNDLKERSEAIAEYPHILKSAAMGPWETQDADRKELDRRFEILTEYIDKYKAELLGEFGLDNYCGYGPKELQEYLMLRHMEFAREKSMRIIIHNREADNQIIRIIRQYPDVRGIIHCFSGNREVLKTALDLGYYISYAGNITFKSNNELRETLKLVPADRLLLETDAPYLTPVPKRGTKNTPANMVYTYRCVAEYLGKSPEQLAEEIYGNFTCFCQHLS